MSTKKLKNPTWSRTILFYSLRSSPVLKTNWYWSHLHLLSKAWHTSTAVWTLQIFEWTARRQRKKFLKEGNCGNYWQDNSVGLPLSIMRGKGNLFVTRWSTTNKWGEKPKLNICLFNEWANQRVPKPIRDSQITVTVQFKQTLPTAVPSVFSQSGLLATYSFLTWVASFWDRFCAESKCCKVCATCAATPTASQNANGVVQLALSLWLVEHLWRSMHFCMFIPALPTHYSKTVLYVQKVRVLHPNCVF